MLDELDTLSWPFPPVRPAGDVTDEVVEPGAGELGPLMSSLASLSDSESDPSSERLSKPLSSPKREANSKDRDRSTGLLRSRGAAAGSPDPRMARVDASRAARCSFSASSGVRPDEPSTEEAAASSIYFCRNFGS